MVFQIFIGLNKFLSSKPLCPHSDADYGLWYWITCYAVLGGFLFTWNSLFAKIITTPPGDERVPYLIALNIVSMGTLATLIALLFNWGGVCIDELG